MILRQLKRGDEATLENFLEAQSNSNIFLLCNLKNAGLSFSRQKYQGEYFCALSNDLPSRKNIVGVIAHYWNDNILVHLPEKTVWKDLTQFFMEQVTRPIAGIFGPLQHADHLIKAFKIPEDRFRLNVADRQFQLTLENMIALPSPATDNTELLHISNIDKQLLKRWLIGYEVEALGAIHDQALEARIDKSLSRIERWTDCWALISNGIPVSMSGFSARIPNTVQIGPVWTPPEHRNKGYARRLVFEILQNAKLTGITKATLTTDSPAAMRAYESIGFKACGFYKLAILKTPLDLNNAPT